MRCAPFVLVQQVLFLAGFQPFVYTFVYAAVARSLGLLVQWKIMNFVMRAKYVLVDFSTTVGRDMKVHVGMSETMRP